MEKEDIPLQTGDIFIVSKRLRMDVNINEDSEFLNSLQDKCKQDLSDELHKANQTIQYRNHFLHQLIELMYLLSSMLCSLRKFKYH